MRDDKADLLKSGAAYELIFRWEQADISSDCAPGFDARIEIREHALPLQPALAHARTGPHSAASWRLAGSCSHNSKCLAGIILGLRKLANPNTQAVERVKPLISGAFLSEKHPYI